MSRCDMPRAYMEITRDSTSEGSELPLGTATGSNDPSRSLGTDISSSPAEILTLLGA